MGIFINVLKISSKSFTLSCPFVDICFQDLNPLCADVVLTLDTFHSNLRKTDVFPLKPGAPKWRKERHKTTIMRYEL